MSSQSVSVSVSEVKPKAKVLIIYYSLYGHVKSLAIAEGKGAQTEGVEVKITQFPEILSEEILKLMYAPPKDTNIPIVSLDDLRWADGILIGMPTRFGTPAAQFKAWWDGTGQLWHTGALYGKPFGIFVSTGSQGGGQESTVLSALPNFIHHGMIFVPGGYHPTMKNLDEVRGGSGYGSGTFSGSDGSRQPSKVELELAELQGKGFAKVTATLAAGRDAQAKN